MSGSGRTARHLTIVTGQPGAGKTTGLIRGLSAIHVGVICPAIFAGGRKTGIEALLLPLAAGSAASEQGHDAKAANQCLAEAGGMHAGKRIVLARHRDLVDSLPPDDTGLQWVFDDDAMAQVNEHLMALRQLFAGEACPCPSKADRVLLIDELGPLELIHGRGFSAALGLLDDAVFAHAVIVVRPSLIDAAKDRWQVPYGTIEVAQALSLAAALPGPFSQNACLQARSPL